MERALDDKRKFYNENNTLLGRALFWEEAWRPEYAIYTLSRYDRSLPERVEVSEDGVETIRPALELKSLYRLYMDANDITEYDFANKYFAHWDHWQTIANSNWFKDELAKWRKELEIRVVSDALKLIQMEAISESKYAYNANRYLADKGWLPKEKTPSKGAGRPSKASIQEEAARQIADLHDIEADLKRLGLN